MSALTVVYGHPVPVATIESRRAHDPETGIVHESYLWDCECGARGQAATMRDAQGDLTRHRDAAHELPGQVTIDEVLVDEVDR